MARVSNRVESKVEVEMEGARVEVRGTRPHPTLARADPTSPHQRVLTRVKLDFTR